MLLNAQFTYLSNVSKHIYIALNVKSNVFRLKTANVSIVLNNPPHCKCMVITSNQCLKYNQHQYYLHFNRSVCMDSILLSRCGRLPIEILNMKGKSNLESG